MQLDIKIRKGDVVLYDRSVTSTDLPGDVVTILKTVHGVVLSVIRKD